MMNKFGIWALMPFFVFIPGLSAVSKGSKKTTKYELSKSLGKMCNDFDQNELRANKTWKGRKIHTKLRLLHIHENAMSFRVADASEKCSVVSVFCHEIPEKELLKYSTGDVLHVTGALNSFSLGIAGFVISVDKCQFQKAGKQPDADENLPLSSENQQPETKLELTKQLATKADGLKAAMLSFENPAGVATKTKSFLVTFKQLIAQIEAKPSLCLASEESDSYQNRMRMVETALGGVAESLKEYLARYKSNPVLESDLLPQIMEMGPLAERLSRACGATSPSNEESLDNN